MKKSSILLIILSLLCVGALLLSQPIRLGIAAGKGTDDAGMEVVFFAGGSENGIFAPILARGALMAGKHLGCRVRIVWSQWSVDLMSRQFKEELENLPDAISVMGHPGMDRLGPLVKEARRKGIVVTMHNVDIPVLREPFISAGAGYVGQDLRNSGRILAEGIIRKYNLKPGEVAVVFQSYAEQDETRGQRGSSVVDVLRQHGLTVHSTNTPYEHALDASTPAARAYIRGVLRSQKNLRVLVNDGILNNDPIIDELKSMGLPPGEIKYGTFDLSSSSVKHLKTGYIGLVHDQQPFLQGYYSVLQAYMAKKYHFSGLYVDTGLSLIDAVTLADVEALFESGIR